MATDLQSCSLVDRATICCPHQSNGSTFPVARSLVPTLGTRSPLSRALGERRFVSSFDALPTPRHLRSDAARTTPRPPQGTALSPDAGARFGRESSDHRPLFRRLCRALLSAGRKGVLLGRSR